MVDGRPSMRDVADRAGVAVSSVSRVIADHPDVSTAMKDRVQAAISDLGYQPDHLAQSLRRQETMTVGFVIGDVSNPLLAEFTLGAEVFLQDAGYSMLLANSRNRPELDAQHVNLFRQRRTDGLLLSLASEIYPETIKALGRVDKPMVAIDRQVPGDLDVSHVRSDHQVGMRDAVNFLFGLGHRRIALINGPPMRPARERKAGLISAYEMNGFEPTWDVLAKDLSPEHGAAATRILLEREEPPTAIISGGNQILLGVLEALGARSRQIGVDISLVSCDEVPLTRLSHPPIAVIRRDNRGIGREAASILLRRMQGEAVKSPTVLPTEFVLRESCAAVP